MLELPTHAENFSPEEIASKLGALISQIQKYQDENC